MVVDETSGYAPNDAETLFIDRIKSLRHEHGYSQADLARRLSESGLEGFHQTTVSRIEKRERPLRLNEAQAISKALGVPLPYFTTEPSGGTVSKQRTRVWTSQVTMTATISIRVGDGEPRDVGTIDIPVEMIVEAGDQT